MPNVKAPLVASAPHSTTRIVRNGTSILAVQIATTLISIASTPYIISKLGIERYGIFAFLLAFSGYLAFLDLGIGWALIKFVAEDDAKADRESLQRSISTALFTVTGIAVVVGVVVISVSNLIVSRFLTLPAALAIETKSALWLTALAFMVNAATGTLNSVLRGLHFFDIISVLQLLLGGVTIAGTVGVLYLGHGLEAVVTVYLLIACVSLLAHLVILRRVRSDLRFTPALHRAEFHRMFSFSMFTTVNRVCLTGLFQVDKLLVAYFLPVASLSYYSVAFNIAQKLNVLASTASTVMFPIASHQLSSTNHREYSVIYRKTAKVVFLLTGIGTVILMVFARPFFRTWLGGDFETFASTPLVLLSVGFFSVSVSSVEAVSIEGAGHPRMISVFMLLSSTINVLLCWTLIPRYGVVGAAGALAVSLTVLAILNILYFHLKLIPSTLASSLKANYGISALLLCLTGIAAAALGRIRMDTFAPVIGTMMASGIIASLAGMWVLLGREAPRIVKSALMGLRV